jgi:hypothetical protein
MGGGASGTSGSGSGLGNNNNEVKSPLKLNATAAKHASFHLLSTDDVDYWSSLSTWLCSLGGLRCYVPIRMESDVIHETSDNNNNNNATHSPNDEEKTKTNKKGNKSHLKRTTFIISSLELRWLVEVDMVSEMLKAFPMGSPSAYPLPLIQNRINEAIKLGNVG